MTRQELTSALRRTGLVHEDAIEDPEGWDGCVTEARIGRLHEELFGDALMEDEQPWIGVDLDGTLAHYDEWRGIEHIGEPIGPMWRRVMGWLQEGKQVRILTARVGPQRHDVPHSIAEIRGHIEQWCLKHLGQVLPVTCQKDYNMVEFWDDRCVQVVPNEGVSMHEQYAQFAVELNQRLIERQESYLAQVVRIEGTWRERLRAANCPLRGKQGRVCGRR